MSWHMLILTSETRDESKHHYNSKDSPDLSCKHRNYRNPNRWQLEVTMVENVTNGTYQQVSNWWCEMPNRQEWLIFGEIKVLLLEMQVGHCKGHSNQEVTSVRMSRNVILFKFFLCVISKEPLGTVNSEKETHISKNIHLNTWMSSSYSGGIKYVPSNPLRYVTRNCMMQLIENATASMVFLYFGYFHINMNKTKPRRKRCVSAAMYHVVTMH